jgi:hypothetical protein
MPQNSASPKRESHNPHQTFCEFRKFAAGHGNRINYLCIESNPLAKTQNHIQSELTNAITGTPHPSLPVGIFSHGRSG